MNGLYYYKLVSEYPEDITKNCKLSINEIDSNFKTLKDFDIKTAEFVRGEDCKKADGTLVITRNNGDKIIVPLDVSVCEDRNLTYDLKVSATECEKSGTTLTISYKDDAKDDEGNPIVHTVTIENIITKDNLIDVLGSDILTKVISDSSLRGLGTMSSPLGIAGTEKTGMLAPAIKLLDLTDGSELPEDTKLGTRYVTKEYVNDYGYLYNGAGVEKISQILDNEYEKKQIYKEVDGREYYWRVPSKADWDALLDSIEPCKYRNHKTAQCHIELGKLAGKFLKSDCGWINSEYECTCDGKIPYDGCSVIEGEGSYDDIFDFSNLSDIPEDKKIDPVGIDKYGMSIRPAGIGGFKKSTATPFYEGYRYTAAFWTTTILAPGQDTYVKMFNDDMSGVWQVAECPDPYYSVRLVKNYDGNNYRETEYINGVLYRCILMPESGQIWLASNFADKKGFITMDNRISGEIPELLEPNGGVGMVEKRIEMFINEYNGRYWEKKIMDEGMTIVIERPCFDNASGTVATYCWYDGDGYKRCIEVEIPKIAQENIEYRVYKTEDGCDKELRNTDDLVVERVLGIVIPMIDEERWEREKADTVLSGMIEDLRDDLNEEISARTEADEVLSGAIDDLRDDVDELSGKVETLSGEVMDLREDLEKEIEERKEADEILQQEIEEVDGQLIDWSQNPFTLSAATFGYDYNLVLPSKDGIDEHSIKILFSGDFGEI